MTTWWHAWSGTYPDEHKLAGCRLQVLVGPTSVDPDRAQDLADFKPPGFASVDEDLSFLEYVASWDHEPTWRDRYKAGLEEDEEPPDALEADDDRAS